MSSVERREIELVVGPDGSIAADQLLSLGFGPGSHLRVVHDEYPRQPRPSVAGTMPDLPDLTWEDFERGSRLARADTDPA